MAEEVIIEYFLYLITGMVGFVLMRVWKIPTIENKLDNVVRETETNRHKIHNMNNTLYQHETRITLLEKSEEKAKESKAASQGPSR
jgi:hypothetical protein